MKNMKLKLLTILVLLISLNVFKTRSQVMKLPNVSNKANQWICYRSNVNLDLRYTNVRMKIAADSKYWLWINGELKVIEGSLKRGPNPQDTYYDILEGDYGFKKGMNTISVLVWYFGKNGFSHRSSDTPGLYFDMEVKGKSISNIQWKANPHPAFYTPIGEKPNFRLSESNIGFNSIKDVSFSKPDFDDSLWNAVANKSLQDAGWNNLIERPIPMWKDYGLKDYERIEKRSDTIIAYLPYNAQVTPYLKIKSAPNKRIDIRTDNYMGGSALNVFAEYITCSGEQEFECMGWMNGHKVIYTIPDSVEVISLKYRETGFDTEFKGLFWCNDEFLNSLWNKSQRTLYITMRDTYMDCPDRERAQWWGDVVNELGEAFYALDQNAHKLTRKGIRELMDWQRPDSTIFSPIPAGNWGDELPMQMLASIGYYGFWTYYMGSGDKSTIEYVFPKVSKYIHVWKTDSEGFVIPRKGGWTWGDWGENKDMELLYNLWYIIALDGYSRMASLVGDKSEYEWADNRANNLRKAFHSRYWNGMYYVSPRYKGCPDDRAQALAIVSHTLPKSCYPVIVDFFNKHYHASPYMEKYVLQALCNMGYYDEAIRRMKDRYRVMTESPLTTLWEGWGIGNEGFGGGSYNHAWSGGPLTIMSAYLAGIETVEPKFKVFSFCPNLGSLNHIKSIVPLYDNRIIKVEIDKSQDRMNAVLEIPKSSVALIGLPKGYREIRVNGKVIHANSKLKKGFWRIEYIK